MSLNLNKVILGGRLTATPELKQTPSGISVCSFSIAVNRRGKDAGADFLDCVAWRQTAEFITKYFNKGNAICIVGNLQKRMWETKNGEKRYTVEIIVDEATFVDGKSSTDNAHSSVDEQEPTYSTEKPVEPKFETISTDDDLPF